MLNDREGFVSLPGEQRLFTSPPRTSITLESLNKSPSAPQPFSLSCADGKVYLTTRRVSHTVLLSTLLSTADTSQVVYIPTKPPAIPPSDATTTFPPPLQSFAAPITHLHDTRVTAPWFGPNEVVALAQPVPNGGIPATHPAIKLTLTFRDGGAYDFHTKFTQVRERLAQALEARGLAGLSENAGRGGGQAETMAALSADLTLEDLPAYEESAGGRGGAPPVPSASRASHSAGGSAPIPAPVAVRPAQTQPLSQLVEPEVPYTPLPNVSAVPAEPPPGYDEVQSGGVSADELERRLSDHKEGSRISE